MLATQALCTTLRIGMTMFSPPGKGSMLKIRHYICIREHINMLEFGSVQNLVETTELTRHVLGSSAVVAQKVQTLGENRTEATTLFPSGKKHCILASLVHGKAFIM